MNLVCELNTLPMLTKKGLASCITDLWDGKSFK